MVKLRQDVKKVQILTEGFEDEVHYLERAGNFFLYTYLSANGEGVVHQLKDAEELEKFVSELYEKYVEYWEVQARTVKVNLKEDLEKIKEYLNI